MSLTQKYFSENGFDFPKTELEESRLMKEKLNPDITKKLLDMIDQRSIDKDNAFSLNEDEFYELKNQDYNTGIYFSVIYDGSLIYDTCKWIENNKDKFGKTILDVGCDTGILSCFLAKLLPDSKITSIDDGNNAIRVAKQLASNLGLNNIEFVHSSLSDFEGVFDTVFSSRTLHENLNQHMVDNYCFLKFDEICAYITSALSDYLKTLYDHIKIDGNLVCIERLANIESQISVYLKLDDLGLKVERWPFERIISTLTVEELPVFVAYKQSDYEKKDFKELLTSLVENEFTNLIASSNNGKFENLAGKMVLFADAGELIEGYYLYKSTNQVGKLAIFTSKSDENILYYHYIFAPKNFEVVNRFNNDLKYELLRILKSELQEFQDLHIYPARYRILNDQEVIGKIEKKSKKKKKK